MSHNYSKAKELQIKWASLRRRAPFLEPLSTVAGGDVAFSPDGKWCVGAIVVLRYPDFQELESVSSWKRVDFPYIPGFLSFREAPALIKAAQKLSDRPDVLLVDGQGVAHPRRFGLACHVGVELDWPTIGCAKSRLTGTHRAVGTRKGCSCRLLDDNEIIGVVLRSREKVKCIYVSEGHRVELEQAKKLVLQCCTRFRLPEPVRRAHQLVTQLRTSRALDMRSK